MNRLSTAILATALLAMPAGAQETSAEDLQTMTYEARQVSRELVSSLGAALNNALADSGPEGAIGVCRDTAPALAGALSRQTGWKVARVSLRPRNPMIGQPDVWEQEVLERFDDAAAAAKGPAALQFGEIVSEPDGRYFRYMQALPVKPLCLTCHGTEKTIPPSVRTRLEQDYPNDRATGYYAGEIRGAVTIKRKLDNQP